MYNGVDVTSEDTSLLPWGVTSSAADQKGLTEGQASRQLSMNVRSLRLIPSANRIEESSSRTSAHELSTFDGMWTGHSVPSALVSIGSPS